MGLGYLRFFLVVAVIQGHFTGIRSFWQHYTAVIGLFTLSGFLITRMMCEVYENSARGKAYFLINRFVRVYPTYWVCLLICVLIIEWIPETTKQLWPSMVMPSTWQIWLPQFTILGLSSFASKVPKLALLPTAWSLSTEIVYYLTIGLLTGYSRRLSLAGLVISIIMTAILYLQGATFYKFYYTIYGTAPAFFLGSVAYHYRHTWKNYFPFGTLFLLCLANVVVYVPNMLDTVRRHPEWQAPIVHFSVVFFALTVMRIYECNKAKAMSKIEQFCADIAYPMFLIHWPVGALAKYILQIEQKQGHELFFAALAFTLVVATPIVFLVEIPVKKVRVYFRRLGSVQKITRSEERFSSFP